MWKSCASEHISFADCGVENEDINHLLLERNFPSKVLFDSFRMLRVRWVNEGNLQACSGDGGGVHSKRGEENTEEVGTTRSYLVNLESKKQ